MYIPGLFTSALLLAELVATIYAYVSMHQALDRTDAIVLFVLIPIIAISLCTALFIAALRQHRQQIAVAQSYTLSTAWTAGALLGLAGLLFAVLVGPHLAAVFMYFLAGQVLIFFVAHVSRLRKH